jgi:hypothetical protein
MSEWVVGLGPLGRWASLASLPFWARRVAALCACSALAFSPLAEAQFAAAVTPPRFEVDVLPGQVSRQVLDIGHALPGTGLYRVYTNDWRLSPDGSVSFFDELQAGSCRPWVVIEREEIAVPMGRRLRYRFEITPPADAPPQECRFALMLESRTQEVKTGENTSFPMNGRIAVIVYARVGGVAPALSWDALQWAKVDEHDAPVIHVTNGGQATGRLTGVVEGRMAGGEVFEFTPQTLPILPGQTRQIALMRHVPDDTSGAAGATLPSGSSAPAPAPLSRAGAWQFRGVLEYGRAGELRLPIDAPLQPARGAP